jgi:hypothetical protein
MGAQAVGSVDRGVRVRHADVDVHGAGRRALEQTAERGVDRLVAGLRHVADVPEARRRVQPAADQRRARVAHGGAELDQVGDGALGAPAHAGGGLEQ